jgi:NAD(P)-dependent dehydrogenase (short-subunit alcohol dehydrogenase family)
MARGARYGGFGGFFRSDHDLRTGAGTSTPTADPTAGARDPLHPVHMTPDAGQHPAAGRLVAKEFVVSVLDRFRLDGRVAIVTGASSGLGVDFAKGLAEAGADVALGARRADRLSATAQLVEKEGRRALAVATDVADPASCQRLVDAAMETFGRVDILVNNAGIGTAVPALSETPEQFRSVIDVNLNGCYWMAQAAARVMQPGSSIVNISSVLGLKTAGLPQAAYSASKAALFGLTRDLAQQWTGRRGIRVNALAPGFFKSEMTDEYRPGYVETQMSRVLGGRFGDPEELTAALLFLASDAGSFVTGQTLAVDGGFTIT